MEIETEVRGEINRELSYTSHRCPECGSRKLIEDYDMGEVTCGDCGLVIHERIMNEGQEWHAFTHEEKEQRSRVGLPAKPYIPDKGLSTNIGREGKDMHGKKLPSSTRFQMYRLRKWQYRTRIHSSVERNLSQAMPELDMLVDKLNIPPFVKEQAALIYRRALDKGLIRGRPITAVTAASLYAACRFARIPRVLDEVVAASSNSSNKKKSIRHCYRLILYELDMKMPTADPVSYVSKIASKVGIDDKTQLYASEILRKAEKKRLNVGKDPAGLAAAALYISNKLKGERKVMQRELAVAADVTEVTVRNGYSELVKSLKDVMPELEELVKKLYV